MVRFKNRYILVGYEDLPVTDLLNEKSLLKIVKQAAEDMMGELFLAKIAFSLQIKYLNLGYALIRVPRDHCRDLQACLFVIKGLRVISVSGTIRNMQKKLFELLRMSLKRELSAGESDLIQKIDYS